VFDDKVFRRFDSRPPGLSSREYFAGLEILETLVFALDQDLVIDALEIVSPLYHRLDNHKDLPISGVVVLFSGSAFSSVEIDWAKNTESVVQVKHSGDCTAACIGQQNYQFLQLEMLENQCFCKGLF
jgi:hypothetical protein